MPPANPMSLKRIHREVADLQKEDLGPMTLAPTDSLYLWRGSLPGPQGSPYEGGVFHFEVQLAPDYPFSAPNVVFTTRIYHMNISERGSICMDILKHNWSPALSLFKVMLSLSSLLTDPNPQDPLVPSIATQYVRNRKGHDTTARQWTELYAHPKGKNACPQSASSGIPTIPSYVPEIPTRVRGRRPAAPRAAAPSNGAAASSSSRGSRPNPEDVILIEDDAPPPRGVKRRRAAAESGGGSGGSDEVVIVDVDDDGLQDGPASTAAARKRPRAAAADESAAEAPALRSSGDVIVIDD